MNPLAIVPLVLSLGATSSDLGQWTIYSERGNEEVYRLVVALLPVAQRDLERQLGLALRGHPAIVLSGSTESFRRSTPGVDHRHTLGVAFPEQEVIYLNCQRIEQEPYESFAVTLRHELSHLIVGEVARRGNRRVPLWFDEGVAVWTSGKLPFYDTGAFARAVAASTLPPLSDLEDAFPLDPTDRGMAYEQGESVVRFIARQGGDEAIRRILRGAADGLEFDAAVKGATGMDLATLERRWLAEVRPRWPWLSWALNAFTLFGIMSLLAVFAFGVYCHRRRQKFREWDLEEGLDECRGRPWWH